MDALARVMMYPRTNAFIFRRTFPELDASIIQEAKRSYPPELYSYNQARHEMTMCNGSHIYFRHIAQADDMYNYQGVEIQFLYFDELTSFEERMYDFLCTRLRANVALGVTPIVRSASNPGGIGHGWVKSRFVDAGPYMSKQRREIYSPTLNKTKVVTTQYIPALATDNPHITQDYIFELERKPDALRKALLYGHWDAFEGQVFVEWKDDPAHYRDRKWTHVVEPFPIPVHWKRYFSFDYGYAKPFACGWFAMSPEGVAYLYREWYGWNGKADVGMMLSPRQIAEGIVDREQEEAENNISILRIADPSIFDSSRGNSVAQQMEPHNYMNGANGKGVFFEPGDNARLAGLAQVHERLRFDAGGKPMLQVFNTCKNVIRTLPNLPYGIRNVEDVDTQAEDHCLAGDTEVFVKDGIKKIKDLVGTEGYVCSHDGQLHRYFDCRKTQENVDVYTITTLTGHKVTATKNHRFMMVDGEWKRLDELKVGDRLKHFFLPFGAKIKSIEYAGKMDVYNMEVSDTHSFIVNGGIVAHNCYDMIRYFTMACPMATIAPHKTRKRHFDPYSWDMEG